MEGNEKTEGKETNMEEETCLGHRLAKESDLARERVEVQALKVLLHGRDGNKTVRDTGLG